jgi:hypothetical protein
MQKYDNWINPFKSLNLLSGTLIPIVNDDEDMLKIIWDDGMQIDIGYIKNEATYYITTVADDTTESWNKPLSVIKVKDCMALPIVIQKEIIRCRL